ncbi:MAG: hypothetical protein R3B70_25770 [Polyangiaceae bacterium]
MPLPGSARDLFLEIRRHLVEASDEGALSSSQSDIFRLLKTAESPFRDRDQKAIVGGEKDLKRTGDHPCFVRHDGARLHFTITVTQRAGEPLFLFAYDFELMFPKDLSPRFVRFDLNEPDHRNDREGIRSHLHPGHDDLQVPAPLLHPVELLDVLIYDAVHPEKQRRA